VRFYRGKPRITCSKGQGIRKADSACLMTGARGLDGDSLCARFVSRHGGREITANDTEIRRAMNCARRTRKVPQPRLGETIYRPVWWRSKTARRAERTAGPCLALAIRWGCSKRGPSWRALGRRDGGTIRSTPVKRSDGAWALDDAKNREPGRECCQAIAPDRVFRVPPRHRSSKVAGALEFRAGGWFPGAAGGLARRGRRGERKKKRLSDNRDSGLAQARRAGRQESSRGVTANGPGTLSKMCFFFGGVWYGRRRPEPPR